MNKFFFYPDDDSEFRLLLKDKKRIFCEIWIDDTLIDAFERDCSIGWGTSNSRKNQMYSYNGKIRDAKTGQQIYENAEIYTWIPQSTETTENYKRPDKKQFFIS